MNYIFIANAKDGDPSQLEELRANIWDARDQLPGGLAGVMTGKEHFDLRFSILADGIGKGRAWGEWVKDVVFGRVPNAPDGVSGVYFTLFVVPDRVVGQATKAILTKAMETGRPVVYTPDCGKTYFRITGLTKTELIGQRNGYRVLTEPRLLEGEAATG